ncbi:hypothetical protein [Frigidibacter sp. ROC022]|uniref:hypothetical protein n=1 Tax=Frigidibacter sp. ROC022 TaxID=2971796 RepID=UPI00215A2692|nr:hypothetical protein [Frigidibacter sp. ROC022]MCR8726632.1 hypothetical protein [Frigidibacter sp. ROC022]
MRRLLPLFPRLALVIVLSGALAGIGFAHRLGSQAFNPAVLAYVQAGGSLADICGGFGDSSVKSGRSCDACRLVHAVALPEIERVCLDFYRSPIGRISAPRVQAEPSVWRDLSHPVRAPPQV